MRTATHPYPSLPPSQGKFNESIAAYRAGLQQDPNNAQGHSEKAEVEAAVKALNRARDLVQETRPSPNSGNGSSNAIARKRLFLQANAQLDVCLALAPSSFDAKLLKLECQVGLGQYDDALNSSNHLLRLAPSLAPLLHLRATCLYRLGNFENSIKHSQQAVRSDPDNTSYVALLKKVRSLDNKKKEGDAAFTHGQYQKAIEAWTEALAVDPTHKQVCARLYNNRATAYAKMRKHADAVSDCKQALALDPQYLKALKRKAESLFVLGGEENLEQCLRDYETAAGLAPEEEERDEEEKAKAEKEFKNVAEAYE
eukprot:evm.model.NODE_7452_length_1495_cov_21.506355.1